ncbi:MAG TPA: TorF family putative porin [Burkholderiaceae bacterium]|nr:TorF family putative porin [Burkholderiaceae bacterium]
MKKLALAAALSAVFSAAPTLVLAQAAAPKSDWTIAGNAGLFSDYRFRGYSQTGYRPAFQGGIDIGHSSGLYVGNWNSNVEQELYNGASLEMDFYGGYKGTLGPAGYDIGYIYYYYPNSGSLNRTKIKNGEVYLGGSLGPVSAKWYYSTTKFFSIGDPPTYADVDTKGSWYLDLTGTFDLGNNLGLVAHYGYQKIRNGKDVGLLEDKVSDWKVGLTYDLSGWLFGASVVGTSEENQFTTARSGFTEGAGKTRVVASVSKTF